MDNWPSQIELLEYSVLDSTNAEGKRLAFQDSQNSWIFAQKQTDGKGSRGRGWCSDGSNLTASFLFYPSGTIKELAQRTFTTSLALFDSLVYSGVKSDQLILKWPNDVLLNKKKVSGILLETSSDPNSERVALIIGVGLNLVSYPDLHDGQGLNKMPTALNSVLGNKTPKALTMLTYIANSLQYWEKMYRDEGFLYIKDAWLKLSYDLGSKVRVSIKGEELKGSFHGISDDGSFLLKSNETLLELSTGDVFFADI